MGSKHIRTTAFMLILATVILPIGCKKKTTSRFSGESVSEVQGRLGIVHAGPQGGVGSVRDTDEIVVVFDHPMAPLSDRPFEDSTAVFKIDPSVEGTFRWLGTRTLAFRPKSRLPFATEFKVTIPSGTRSLDGYALKEDYVWTFETIRPRLVRQDPQNDERQLRLETEVLLVFNQPVDESAVRDFVSISGAADSGKEERVEFAPVRPDLKSLQDANIPFPVEQALLLRPRSKLKPGFIYAVELRAGLIGREGRLPLEKNAVIRFSTFNAFRFEGLDDKEGHAPNEPLQFHFSNRVVYKEFIRQIKIEPKIEIPEYYSSWDHGNDTLWITLPLQPETRYSITIPSSLQDDFGNILGRDEVVTLTTGSLPPFVRLTTGPGVVESYGDLTYPLFAVNTAQVRVRAARLTPEEAIPVLASSRAFSGRESYQPSASFYSYDQSLPLNLPRNERGLVPLHLRNIEPDGHGFIFLQLDTYAEEEWSRFPKVFLQLTELGISSKFSPENNVIWVSELKTGQPVSEAGLEIRDDLNRILWTGRTDKDGRAETPGWRGLGLRPKNRWSKPRQWVIARFGKSAVLASSEESKGVEPYRFNINYDWNPEPQKIEGTIFSERGIYRAGETVHLKGLLRQREKGRWLIPSIREVACDIQDPFQKSVGKTKVVLDKYGSFAYDFDTREDASLGTYTITAAIPSLEGAGAETRISETFRVEAFRAAEFEVHLKSPRESYVFGDAFEGSIRAGYLFGGAMSGQKAVWSLRLNPTSFIPPGFKGFSFGNDIDMWSEDVPAEQSRLLGSGEGFLDKDGRLSVKIPLVAEKEHGTVSADLEATVQSPSRRSISNRIQTIIHQGAFYIGLKPASSFLKKGDALPVQIIASSPDGTLQADRSLTVKLAKREWRSARKAGLGGRLEWISEKIDTEIASQEVRTKRSDPVEVRFQPEKSGLYVISAEARDGAKNRITTATLVYVTGGDYVPWERKDDDAIDLVADAESYKPGETARLLVKSPYEKAKALVTIEREFILRSEVVEIDGSSAEIAVPITSDLIPNAYVSVLLIQGRTSNASPDAVEDAGKPSFKMGYAELKVNPEEKRLGLDIKTDKSAYKPGDSVELRLRAQDIQGAGTIADLAVAVVDVGVINLIGYQTPDPFAAFYGERSLSVQTSETRVHIVGQRHFGEKGENPGGGGAEMGRGLSLSEVQLRGDFKSTAYWNPSVTTDAGGYAVVKFKLPDNLTTFRIMAVAQTLDSRFGRGAAEFKVAKPLLMLPALPRFARVGDAFQGGVLLTNNSGTRGTVQISLQAKGLISQDRLERTIDLEPNASQEVLFAFTADAPGTARLAFRAVLNGETDGLEAVVPVELPRPLVTIGLSDQTETSREEKIIIPAEIHPNLGEIDLRASASALNGLQNRLDELVDYPYLCLEQRLSRILPFIIAPRIIRDFKLSSLAPDEIDRMIRSSLREVYACQKQNGGFSLWPDSAFDSPYVSGFAVFTLLKAYEAGIPIDKLRLDSGLKYLKTTLQTRFDSAFYPYNRRGWATVQALALYDLALAGRSEAAYAEKLFQERANLPLFGRALLYKALNRAGTGPEAQNVLAREFLNQVKVTAADAHFEEEDPSGLDWIYSSNARTTAIILQALIEAGHSGPFLPGAARWLVQKKTASRWTSTQENFFVFYALNDYYQKVEKGDPDFQGKIILAGKILLEENFRVPTAAFRASVPLTAFSKGKELPFRAEKSGSGLLYYSLRMSYAPQKSLPPRDEGFAVYKKITTLDGRPLETIPAGTLAVVTLEVAVPKESLYVVVEDPLPAGFEAVQPNFRTESEERLRKLDDLAEADNRPWWDGFNHVEMHDNRVLLFADSLRTGVHHYRYLVRALTYGAFGAPGTQVQQMYAPEVFGRAAEQVVKILK